MGGGGNFFSSIGNAVASVFSSGPSGNPMQDIKQIAKAIGGDNQEGGTPTANASKQSASMAATSQTNQAANANAGSGTMLTGNAGVDPQSLELGKKTLLGG